MVADGRPEDCDKPHIEQRFALVRIAPEMGEVEGQVRNEELDAEREARRRLALAQVRQYPDPVLRMKAHEVKEIDDSVTGLVERMKGLMSEARGVGLAASVDVDPQGLA